MKKTVSIVLSPGQVNYRKVAQRNWGLTDEQMRGKHVHHHPPVSEGGRNIPEHLYVCSPSLHAHGWHDETYFIEHAGAGGRKNLGKTNNPLHLERKSKALKGKNKNKRYWHNPLTGDEKFVVECPGEEWVFGMSPTHKANCYKPVEKQSVICVYPDGKEVEFESAYKAAKVTGKDRGDIGKCCRGKRNRTGELQWRYKG